MDIKDISVLLVLFAAIGTAIWNLHVKQAAHSLSFVILMTVPQLLIALPLVFFVPSPKAISLFYILTSAIIQNIYIIFLVHSYRYGMVTAVYPLAVGMATIIALIFWHHILNQPIAWTEYLGILFLTIVILILTTKGKVEVISWRSYLFAIGTSVLIFSYSSIDTVGIKTAEHPLSYISWLFLIKGLLLFPLLFFVKLEYQDLRSWRNFLIAGVLAGIGYGIAIFAFNYSSTSIILALRSTSILFIYMLSVFLVREKPSWRLLMVSLLSFLGIFLILASK